VFACGPDPSIFYDERFSNSVKWTAGRLPMSTLRFLALGFLLATTEQGLGSPCPSSTTASLAIHATIDGVAWEPGGVERPAIATVYEGDSTLTITGRRTVPRGIEMVHLRVRGLTTPGAYRLSAEQNRLQPPFTIVTRTVWGGGPGYGSGGTVVVTQLDRQAHMIRGTFSFTSVYLEEPPTTDSMVQDMGLWNTERMRWISSRPLPLRRHTVAGAGEFCGIYESRPYGLILQDPKAY
jgi:hypothetical protein